MGRKDLIDTINTYACLFVYQIKSLSAMGLYDINIHAENLFIPILNIVFNLELKNANQFKKNFPAIDLVDEKKGIAFQLTKTPTQGRVMDVLKGFVSNNLHKQYSTLYIFITSEKQEYNIEKIDKIVQGNFNFDVKTHVFDYRDLLRRISFINSDEVLSEIEIFYQKLAIPQLNKLIKKQQERVKSKGKYQLSSTDQILEELKDVIGEANTDKIPELQKLFQSITDLDEKIQQKEKELKDYQTTLNNFSDNTSSLELLTKAYDILKKECENLKLLYDQNKSLMNALAQNIIRQKEFLDQTDRQEASERMKEASRLFEAGEYSMVSELLNYEGRGEYIRKKLEEKKKQSSELASLADEEVFLALNLLRRQNWNECIDQIQTHFKHSIELGGYGSNSYQYSFFLEDINQQEHAIEILNKTIAHLPGDNKKFKALVLQRKGYLLKLSGKASEALEVYTESANIYELLFEKDMDLYGIEFADTSYNLGSLYLQISLDQARRYLERALLLLGTMEKPGNTKTQQLTFITTIALGYLHQQRNDIEQVGAYLRLALEIGGMMAFNAPDDNINYLLEAVNRFRKLLGEEKEGSNTTLFFNSALGYYLKFHEELSSEQNFNNAKALNKLGLRLIVAQEVTAADVCFRGALNIFRKLDSINYPCRSFISDSLSLVGFKYMVTNNVEAHKNVLLEAVSIRKQLSETEPVENLIKAASLLNELYSNSFIAVPPSEFYKADSFFEEAIDIYKQLDRIYQQPDINGWIQLLQHKCKFISNGLDKTDVVSCYQELVYLKGRMSPVQLTLYEGSIQIAIHELGELLLKNVDIDHPLFIQINQDIISVRTVLYDKDLEKYRYFLISALWKAGKKLYDANRWEMACPHLCKAVILIKNLALTDPKSYENLFVMPTFNLAVTYEKLNDYRNSAICFIDLCNFFESKLSEHPEYLNILVSFMLSTSEVLNLDGQKEKVSHYVSKARAYLPMISNSSEQTRLAKSFEAFM